MPGGTNNLGAPIMSATQKNKYITHNDGIGIIDAGLTASLEVEVDDGNAATLTSAQLKEHEEFVIVPGSPAPTADILITVPAGVVRGRFSVRNATAQAVILSVPAMSEPDVAVAPDALVPMRSDGTELRAFAFPTGLLGAYTDLSDTPASYTGHAYKRVRVKSDETGLEFVDAFFPIYFYAGGTSGDATRQFRMKTKVPFRLPTNLVGSYVEADTACTALTDFDLKKNGASFGTVSFAAAADSATFTVTQTDFADGDVLTIEGPATEDATLAGIAWNVLGYQR